MLELLEEGNESLSLACEEWDFENDGNPTELIKRETR